MTSRRRSSQTGTTAGSAVEDQAMNHPDLGHIRSGTAVRRAIRPLLLGGAFCLLILFLGQWAQACNGVQACPPRSLRPNTAEVWATLLTLATVVAIVARVALPRWAGRLAITVLTAIGVAGALLTLFVTGF